MRRPAVGAIAALLALVVGIGAFFILRDDDDDGNEALSSSTTTSSTLFEDTTSTTASATSSTTAGSSTSSTTARSTSTTTRASTTTTTGSTTTTSTAVATRCGTGNASVSFTAKDLVTDALSSSFTPQATVENKVDQPIEVKEITLEVTYPNNEVRTVRFSTAGTVVAPATSASFTSDKLTSAQRYAAVRFTRFTYFTQGQESTCTVTTP